MAQSRAHARPARILLVGADSSIERIQRVLRAEGHLAEVTADAIAAVVRMAGSPPFDLLLVDGLRELDRDRVLAQAREQNVWCIYLQTQPGVADLPARHRHQLLAALPVDARDAQIARTVRATLAARQPRISR